MLRIDRIKVNGIGSSSFVGIGPTLVSSADTHVKSTIGHVSVRGDSAVVVTLRGGINDADIVDTPIWSSQGAEGSPAQGQEG